MQVLEPVTALLSDYEVFTLLQSNKASRRANQNASENVLTVEFEALEYFTKLACASGQSAPAIEALLTFLRPIKLTKAEKLQIVNLIPRTLVEFYLIVEECEERFTDDQVGSILCKIGELFPLPTIDTEASV